MQIGKGSFSGEAETDIPSLSARNRDVLQRTGLKHHEMQIAVVRILRTQ